MGRLHLSLPWLERASLRADVAPPPWLSLYRLWSGPSTSSGQVYIDVVPSVVDYSTGDPESSSPARGRDFNASVSASPPAATAGSSQDAKARARQPSKRNSQPCPPPPRGIEKRVRDSSLGEALDVEEPGCPRRPGLLSGVENTGRDERQRIDGSGSDRFSQARPNGGLESDTALDVSSSRARGGAGWEAATGRSSRHGSPSDKSEKVPKASPGMPRKRARADGAARAASGLVDRSCHAEDDVDSAGVGPPAPHRRPTRETLSGNASSSSRARPPSRLEALTKAQKEFYRLQTAGERRHLHRLRGPSTVPG